MAQKNLMGQEILGYKVTENLGSGAFGTVYKAVKTNVSGQYVRAIKHITIPTEKQYRSVLNSMGGSRSKVDHYFSQMINNIVSEITILNDLTEKGASNIVRYYENDIQICESPLRYDIYILMEYLTPLEDYIASTELQVRDCMRLAFDILTGLKACHDNNVIHRDIKIDNIFVSNAGSFKIGDFGVSKVLKDSSKAESLKGTPDYLAPEVYLGKEGYTKSVDLYSLGIVLYRLLNYNRNPFLPPFPQQYFSRDEDHAFEERIRGKVPPLPLLGGEEIGRVIVKAISPPEERFSSAEEFKKALEEAVDRTPAEILQTSISYESGYADEEESIGELPGNNLGETIGETFGETLGETMGEHLTEIEPDDEPGADRNFTIHRQLFETMREDQQEKPDTVDFSADTNREKATENPVREEKAVKPDQKKPDTREKERKPVSRTLVVVVVFIVILVFIMWLCVTFWLSPAFPFVIWLAAFIAVLFYMTKQKNQTQKTNARDADMKGRDSFGQTKQSHRFFRR